ncbi:polysaccharide deacetylase family protein [Paenibacillus aurantiacus]|uniref:Polysaccharide deacetylase family protein n=1 Tax=Paenibacillus aurantiacus TaxID=1936118 RepID=A0ABV5KQZ0_9BACL
MPRATLPKDLLTSAGTVILPCNTLTGWTTTAGTIALDNQTFLAGKSQSVRIEQTVAGTAAYSRKTGMALDLSDLETLEVVFRIKKRADLSSIRISLENGGSNYYYVYLPVQFSDMIDNHGWYRIRVSRKEFLINGSPSWLSPFTAIGLRVSGNAGVMASVQFDQVAYNVKGLPKVLFTYDDAWQSVYDKAFPIHQRYGQRATTWAVSRFAQSNDPNYARPATLDILHNAGWDIGNHTDGHDRYTQQAEVGGLTGLVESYRVCRDWLRSRGYRGVDHVCYPAGEFGDDLIEGLKSLGVKTARSTISDVTATPVDNLHKLKTFPLGSTTTRAAVLDVLQKVRDTGCSVHFMLHRVEDIPIPPIPDICYPTAELEWLCDVVKSMGFDVVTISEWYEQLTSPRRPVNRI